MTSLSKTIFFLKDCFDISHALEEKMKNKKKCHHGSKKNQNECWGLQNSS
jgi:hypothetical protein